MSLDKGRLASLLKTIYEHTQKRVDEPAHHRRFRILGGSGTRISFSSGRGVWEGAVPDGTIPTLVIYDEGVDAHEAFVEETLKDPELRELVGATAVENALDGLIRSTNGELPSSDLKDTLRYQLLKPLREELQSWVTFVPIVNLEIQKSLTLGDVEFVQREVAERESRDFIANHKFGGTPEEQQRQTEYMMKEIDRFASQSVAFAKVSSRGHEKRVADIAADRVLIALNTLRAHTHLLYSHRQRAIIGLPTELSSGAWQRLALAQNGKHGFHLSDSMLRPLIPFTLNEANVERLMQKCHFGLIQEVLKKPSDQRNSLETALIQAFQALGRAVVAPTQDMFFLGCTIALERMLIHDGEKTTTETWSDRLAVALSDEAGDRKAILQRAKKLYDIRSRIVHAAFSGVIDEDARLMEQWAICVILRTLGRHKSFESHEAFCRGVDPREIGLGGSRT